MSNQNAELELLKQKLAEKDALIAQFMRTEDHLVPLPNGDLHRGMKNHLHAQSNIDVEVIPDSAGNPLDRAMAKILKAAAGGNQLTCMWCGLQWPQTDAKGVREHLKHDHPTVVTGWESMQAEVLMQNLEEANARLAAIEA
jgi:hypothetical protein